MIRTMFTSVSACIEKKKSKNNGAPSQELAWDRPAGSSVKRPPPEGSVAANTAAPTQTRLKGRKERLISSAWTRTEALRPAPRPF